MVLNPLGVPSHGGQLYEAMLGWAGLVTGNKYSTVLMGPEQVSNELENACQFPAKPNL